MENKKVALEKGLYKVENGKVVITSEELANAIQNEGVDLFVDEEVAGLQAYAVCCSGAIDELSTD